MLDINHMGFENPQQRYLWNREQCPVGPGQEKKGQKEIRVERLGPSALPLYVLIKIDRFDIILKMKGEYRKKFKTVILRDSRKIHMSF